MKNKLKASLSYKKTILLISLLSIISGVLCAIIGELMLPLLVAFLAALYLFETGEKRPYSTVTSLMLVAINVAGILLGINVSVFSICGMLISFVLSVSYLRGVNKAEASFLMTIICALSSVAGLAILAIIETGEYTISAITTFYTDIFGSIKDIFVSSALEMYNEIYASAGMNITMTAEEIGVIFDYQMYMVISYVIIGAFITVGLAVKIFSAIIRRCSENNKAIGEWSFMTSNVFVYFYVILSIATIFTDYQTNLVAITLSNLYMVFMVVYAYSGIKFAYSLIRTRLRPLLSVIILAAALILFSSFAVNLMAVLGVISTLRKNNEDKIKGARP